MKFVYLKSNYFFIQIPPENGFIVKVWRVIVAAIKADKHYYLLKLFALKKNVYIVDKTGLHKIELSHPRAGSVMCGHSLSWIKLTKSHQFILPRILSNFLTKLNSLIWNCYFKAQSH